MANTARVTQSALELLTSANGVVEITQDAIEFVTGAGIDCGNPPDGSVGIAYNHTFPFGGGTPPYTFALAGGAFPPGLSLNTSTAQITGTPTLAGTYIFTVSISDSMGTTGSVTCSITIGNSQSLLIQLYGWKLYPESPCGEPEEAPEIPHVDRAF